MYRFNLDNLKKKPALQLRPFMMVPLNNKIRSFVISSADEASDFLERNT